MKAYCRVLNTDLEVEYFVDGVLKISEYNKKRKAINSITAAERNIKDYDQLGTLNNRDNRDFEYRDQDIRINLRSRILKELIELERLENDDDIEIEKGGAKPKTEIKSEKKVFYIIGPPASGKSGVANKIADEFGAYILDSDYVKRKLPEYKNQIGSASLVHEESDAIVFNCNNENLLKYCIENGHNMVIPKIGHGIKSICDFCKILNDFNYSVYLISVDLDRQKATQRAYYRFIDTERYVPLSLIFDGYSNQPTLNYFKIKQQQPKYFCGFAQVSTDVDLGKEPVLVEQQNLSEFNILFGGEDYEVI